MSPKLLLFIQKQPINGTGKKKTWVIFLKYVGRYTHVLTTTQPPLLRTVPIVMFMFLRTAPIVTFRPSSSASSPEVDSIRPDNFLRWGQVNSVGTRKK